MLYSLLKKIFRRSNRINHFTTPSKFDKAPFLSPWYFTELEPQLLRSYKALKWEFKQKIRDKYVASMILKDSSDNVYGFVSSHTYIRASPDKSKFLIWSRKSQNGGASISIELFDVEKLSTLKTNKSVMVRLNAAILAFNESNKPYLFAEKCTASIEYNIDSSLTDLSFNFPTEFESFEPFIVIIDYNGLYESKIEYGNTVLLEFDTKQSVVRHYPQDWFNKSDADFAWQWITRAYRDEAGVIHGQGIRIDDFILDDSGRQLR